MKPHENNANNANNATIRFKIVSLSLYSMFLIDIITEPLETIATYIHDSYPDAYFYRKKRWFSIDNTGRSKNAIGFMIDIIHKLEDDIRIEYEHTTDNQFNNILLKRKSYHSRYKYMLVLKTY